MARVDRLLIDPTAAQLREALRAACVAINRNQGRHARLGFPFADLAAVQKRIAGKREGGHEWSGDPTASSTPAVLGAAWWTDFLGRRHIRLNGSDHVGHPYSTTPPLRAGPDLPALACVYPRRTLFRIADGQRRLFCLCPCGAWGPPDRLAWMGDSCGACHDRAEAGEVPLRPFEPITFPDRPWRVAVSPDGGQVAMTDHVRLQVWDLEPRRLAHAFDVRAGCFIVLFAPDGRHLAWDDPIAHDQLTVQPLDGGPARTLSGGAPAFLPGRGGLVFRGQGWLKRYDVDTGKTHRIAPLRGLLVRELAYAPDGTTIAGACREAGVVFWDTASGAERGRVAVPDGPVERLAYSADGRTLAALTTGPRPYLALIDTSRPAIRAGGHAPTELSHPVFCASSALVTRGATGPLRVWEMATGAAVCELSFADAWPASLAVSPDGHWLAVGCGDSTVRFIPAGLLRG
jgi:hypothetical protein